MLRPLRKGVLASCRHCFKVCGGLPQKQLPLFSPLLLRARYSSTDSSTKRSNKSDKIDAPGFKKIFLVAIIGTVIFVKTVQSLDKNKPKTTLSEEEFENVVKGLKRRVAIFPQGEVDIKFSLSPSIEETRKVLQKSQGDDINELQFVDPVKVIDYYRTLRDDRYEALLNEYYKKYGCDTYAYNLPTGMLVMLLGRYFKENFKAGDKLVVVNFPHSIADATRFENEVSIVSKIFVPRKLSGSDVCKYYETVGKADII
ncbi:BAH_G0041230.mRNA.1.CDS.1 [Saccharomyces cerevisiae]|nr:SX2_G0024320.mRNA.1.CDS.1 [Saccharomyces cerevisiae]CAI4662725.1 BAH_G0041230.mRNA.1.CDS.1 [Saccharomyces cerevisiae]CAI4665370.1 BAG_1a_G0041290.mRNA.1.CDS.1 [Saccharomyces cerevisiae]CAI7253480.1 BAG_1a_G0041290.mRNA.1.CDS.1 [Saccharomyces cerevisiae]CAI7255604.1 BAH_G0041230.mRNA.1.CDS.1 [Saccharomyces cerevisiae]